MLIGAPAAGKSTYISASYGELYYNGITTDHRRFRSDKSMTLSHNRILMDKFIAYRSMRYPYPDADFSKYHMNILWDDRVISDIEWIDMAGGDIFKGSQKQNIVRRNLRECDAVMAFYAVDNIITKDQEKFNKTVGMIVDMCEMIEEEAKHRSRPLMVANIFTKSDLATNTEKNLIFNQLKKWLEYKNTESFIIFTECVPPTTPSLVPMVALIAYSMYIDCNYRGFTDRLRFLKNRRFDELQRRLIEYLTNELPEIPWYRWYIL